MPPKPALTGSFSVADVTNEVVCPLRNHDGSSCRKRCIGEKRFRSMQEHIRRAHPEHYIAKLPATEESFSLMINTPPSERPPPPTSNAVSLNSGHAYNKKNHYDDAGGYKSSATPRSSDELRRTSLLPAASAAAALAQLHYQRLDSDWDSEQDVHSEADVSVSKRSRFARTSLESHRYDNDQYLHNSPPTTRELLPSSISRSPPGRSSTLPPLPRAMKTNRPRKSSITKDSRRPRHEKSRSKEFMKRMSHDRKAYSAEPQAVWGKRWEDLIDAATSANEEESSRDLTPIASSPKLKNHTTLPPFTAPHLNSYTASPLQNTLTPPPPNGISQQPFPSVESSTDSNLSGQNFHMNVPGLSADSSPAYLHPVQIYCAACRRVAVLKDSYACTECVCGLCQDCVDVLVAEQTRGRVARCPRCGTVGGRFKPFQLEIRY